MIRHILPVAEIETVTASFVSFEGFHLLGQVDYVFGCVDQDGARLVLNELCSAYSKKYFDLATDTGPEDQTWFGGRVLYSTEGESCLICKGLLDQDAIRRQLSTEGALEEEARIYGVNRSALGSTGPAVVSLNGVVASLAVTEFMAEVTGLRPAFRFLEYRADLGRVVVDRDPPAPDCYYCKSLRGTGEAADVERFIREGWLAGND